MGRQPTKLASEKIANGQSGYGAAHQFYIVLAPIIGLTLGLIIAFALLIAGRLELQKFLIIFFSSVGVTAFVFWIGRHLGVITPPPNIAADNLQRQLNYLFVTSVAATVVTATTREALEHLSSTKQGLSIEEQERIYYNPDDTEIFGPQNFVAARRQSMLGRLESENIKADRVVYLRYITASKQVQLEHYLNVRRLSEVREGKLKLSYQTVAEGAPRQVAYFRTIGGNVQPIQFKVQDGDKVFTLMTPDGEASSVTAIKYYGDFESAGDFFITPLFQIQGSPPPEVYEYVILSDGDAKWWNPNKYLFDITPAPQGLRKISYSTQTFRVVAPLSPDAQIVSDLLHAATTAQCGNEATCSSAGVENARKMLKLVYDASGKQINKGFSVFVSSARGQVGKEHAMWFKLCPNGDGC